jgi:hypothetical protein
MVAERSREAEDQVVPSLVSEQQRPSALEELGWIGELDDFHENSLRSWNG